MNLLCIICQTYEKYGNSSFCSISCATVHSIIISQQLVLTTEEMKQLALNRLTTVAFSNSPRITISNAKVH